MENGNGLSVVPNFAEVDATVKDVADLQSQIQQLLGLQKEAESENQKLAETLKHANGAADPKDAALDKVQHLERELQIRTEDRENFKNKLQLAEKRIAELEQELKAKNESAEPMTDKERATVKATLDEMSITLKSSTAQCETFTRQNGQLCSQVKALKEVIEVHKDLLNIRGMETEQLKTTIKLLEDHAVCEKERRNAVLNKMETAVKLNAELKNEYENQLRIFQELKIKYEMKVELMKAENNRLKALVPVEIQQEVPPEPILEQ